MTENDISYKVRGILYDIYNKLGPGLYESVYEEILAYELIIRMNKNQRKISRR